MDNKALEGYYLYGDQTGVYGNMSREAAKLAARRIKNIDQRFSPKVLKADGPGYNVFVLSPFRWGK